MVKGVFQFKTKRGSKIGLINKPLADFKPPPESELVIEPVQGIMPDSKEEYFVAKALDRLKVDYTFQYSVAGGRALRGGQMVDFMIYTVPLPTPVQIKGEYWHKWARGAQSQFDLLMLENMLKGYARKPIAIWTYELPNIDAAYQVLKRKVL